MFPSSKSGDVSAGVGGNRQARDGSLQIHLVELSTCSRRRVACWVVDDSGDPGFVEGGLVGLVGHSGSTAQR